jgi:hypothetical protein
MRRAGALLLATPLLLLSVFTTGASAHTVKGSFEYHVGDALIESLEFPAGNQAIAPNGDVVTIVATGTFDSAARTATGGGTFSHQVLASGQTVTGTFVTTGMISFQSYGNATPQGLPANFYGGKLLLRIVATPDFAPSVHLPATLTIECVLGSPPAGTEEGVRVNVYDVINFNKSVHESGANLYIRL